MKKYLQQCYVWTKAGACSVARDVGDRLCAFCLSLFFRNHFSREHWCAVGSAEHAGSSDSQLSDMITDGTCSCFMLILEACFTGSSQNVENDYVVNAEILLQCFQRCLWCWKSHTICLWSSALRQLDSISRSYSEVVKVFAIFILSFQGNVLQLCTALLRITFHRTQCGNLGIIFNIFIHIHKMLCRHL